MSNFDALRVQVSLGGVSDSNDFVILEQEPWDPYVGWLTKMGVFGYLNQLLFKGAKLTPNCGYEGGKFGRELYAYPSRQDLAYAAGCSWGVLGPRKVQLLDYSEVIPVEFETQVKTKYKPVSISKYGLVDKARLNDGTEVDKPTISIGDDNSILLSTKVACDIFVTYKVCRHTYKVEISPRPLAIENKLQSFFFAVWSGGNNYIAIEPPEGAEDGECNNFASGGDHFTTGDQPPSSVPSNDVYKYVDYCSQEPTERPVV